MQGLGPRPTPRPRPRTRALGRPTSTGAALFVHARIGGQALASAGARAQGALGLHPHVRMRMGHGRAFSPGFTASSVRKAPSGPRMPSVTAGTRCNERYTFCCPPICPIRGHPLRRRYLCLVVLYATASVWHALQWRHCQRAPRAGPKGSAALPNRTLSAGSQVAFGRPPSTIVSQLPVA